MAIRCTWRTGCSSPASPHLGQDLSDWQSPTGSVEALGLVDFGIFPHLDNPNMPEFGLADAERWAAALDVPGYALDDQTAITVIDGEVNVVSEVTGSCSTDSPHPLAATSRPATEPVNFETRASTPAVEAFVYDHFTKTAHTRRRRVGLAVIRGLHADQRVISSFFLVHGARRGGRGRAAVRTITSQYPGQWTVAFQDLNTIAARFWTAVASEADDHWSIEHHKVPERLDLPADAWVRFTVR